ncbi:YbaB/EbfC family nucleoid-associated protein [Actinomadura napierensis]|uniref:YbaB/EbfC family nucleoid-associated protein n=1 Tax=Actinomadura napierensis TaxID=267854 RepID=A0ABN2YEQ5_9ACTN
MERGLADLDELLTQTRRTLEQMRSASARPGDAETITSTAETVDGRVRATVVSGGRIESLELDPRALRSGAEELAAQIVQVVNAALEELRTQAGSGGPEGDVDTHALAARLGELQADSARGMAVFSQGIAETVARIQSAAGERRD